jgi:hypothetical protein
MLDATLGYSQITIGEMVVILILSFGMLYLFTGATVKNISTAIGVCCWWLFLVAVFIGIPVGLGIRFVMWVCSIPN